MTGQISNFLRKDGTKESGRGPQSDSNLLLRVLFTVISSTILLFLEYFQHSSSGAVVGVEIALACGIYFFCGTPLHRTASSEMAAKRIGTLTLLSFASSGLFWFSFIIANGWIFFPRLFPTRWLAADLSLRTLFPQSSLIILLGLLEIFRRQRQSR